MDISFTPLCKKKSQSDHPAISFRACFHVQWGQQSRLFLLIVFSAWTHICVNFTHHAREGFGARLSQVKGANKRTQRAFKWPLLKHHRHKRAHYTCYIVSHLCVRIATSLFYVACVRLYNFLYTSVGWSIRCWSLAFWAFTCGLCVVSLSFITAPAHLHTTWKAMYPALFFFS